eukprot:g32307.t1
MIDLSSQMVEGNERDDDASKALLCGKCKLPVSLENTVMKSLNQKSVTCKGCHAASVMMSRHFKTMPPAWDSLTDTERVNFFRAILAKKDTEEGPLKFKVLRTELKDVLVRKTVTENKRSVSGEFLPLETYRLRGFDTQRIQDLAEKEVHPILGDTYRVDIKTLSEAFIEQDIEESLTQVEKSVKRNHLPEHMRPQPKKKAKAKKTGKETQEDEGNVEEEGDDLWFLVGIQADVSELSPSKLAKAEREVHCVANDIREKLADELSALAISGALKFTVSTVSGHLRSNKPEDSDEAIWSLLPTPQWRGVGGETLSGEGLERPFAPPATVAPAKAAKSLGLLARLGWVPCTVLLAITCYGVLTRVTSRAWSGSVHPSH